MEKYMVENNQIDRTLNNLENLIYEDLNISHDEKENMKNDETERTNGHHPEKRPQPFTGNHLIILQHGFLGVSFDMRLFAQSITMLCGDNTAVMSLPVFLD
jgi:hypothetical protein